MTETPEDKPQQPHYEPCCQNWDDFARRVQRESEGKTVWYRGHPSTKYELASEWERRLRDLRKLYEREDDAPDWEGYDVHVEKFIQAAQRAPDFDAVDFERKCNARELDLPLCWELLGRHQGLVSRALDWSTNPFVAAFFAYDKLFNEDVTVRFDQYKSAGNEKEITYVCVWALTIDDEIRGLSPVLTLHDFVLDRAERQRAQSGVFTMLAHPRHLDLKSYLAEKDLSDRLVQYHLPDFGVFKARESLREMNITYGILYPDLVGAAKWANQFGN